MCETQVNCRQPHIQTQISQTVETRLEDVTNDLMCHEY